MYRYLTAVKEQIKPSVKANQFHSPSHTQLSQTRTSFPRFLGPHTRLPLHRAYYSSYRLEPGLRRRLAAKHPRNLAEDVSSRGSLLTHSCPDLSNLQISSSPLTHDTGATTTENFDKDIATEPSRSPSPDGQSRTSDQQRLKSTGKRVSRKARGVLGKVRAFHRVAAAKMAHSITKIDTNAPSTKRGLPQENEDEPLDSRSDETPGQGSSVTLSGRHRLLPSFLRQSVAGQF